MEDGPLQDAFNLVHQRLDEKRKEAIAFGKDLDAEELIAALEKIADDVFQAPVV